MSKFKTALVNFLKFMGLVLLIDIGLLALVGLTCLLGSGCTTAQWSDRMFWLSLGTMLLAAPAVIASLSTGRGYFNSPFTAGPDSAIAVDIINRERRELSKRTMFAIRVGVIGAIGIGIAALISTLGG